MPVNFMQFGQTQNKAYIGANERLAAAETIIMIGLSQTGLTSSYLAWNENAHVISTGKEVTIDGSSTLLGCYANDIVWRVQ